MKSRIVGARRSIVAMMTVFLMLGLAADVSAHENREVGDYEFTVGFVNEPAYVNELNGVQLNIARAGDGENDEPVENAHETLDATILYGEETMEVELRPVFGEEGAYTAEVIPTATGSYSFQFVGDIEGQQIDETFRAGPDTFSEVEESDELEFPANPPSPADDSDQAVAIGIAGVVAGLLGLVAGAAAYFKATSNSSQQRSARERRQQLDRSE